MNPQDSLPLVDLRPLPVVSGATRHRLLAGALWRLGPTALLRYARHQLTRAVALPSDAPLPEPPFLYPESHDAAGINWFGPAPDPISALSALAVPTAGNFDIRLVWEAGRLVDLPALAAQDPTAAEGVVRDFVRRNPPFRGPHWACGQEASIRLAHLLAAHQTIGGAMLPGLRALVGVHRDRIAATLSYAMAQDNNHATSEAAGLWLCGIVLGEPHLAGQGRALLERAVGKLFLPGGAFAQQSMRYHVVALEMPAFAQASAAKLGQPGLSSPALARLKEAVAWLAHITDPASGRAWRVGPDDGSRFFGADPDDLRPTLRRAAEAFGTELPFPQGESEQVWLDKRGGFARISAGALRAFLRLPVQEFRPGQADALHLELWNGGVCLLGDAGSALYNLGADPDAPDLARTAAHNTVAFDDDDQMPRLGRFLYGAWLRPAELAAGQGRMLGAYRDWKGRYHRREVRLTESGLIVEDRFDGRFGRAVARFRLAEGDWRIEEATLLGDGLRITAEGAASLSLVRLPMAHRYGGWTTTPALEAAAGRPGRLRFAITVARRRQ